MRRALTVFIFCLWLTLPGCTDDTPAGLIAEETYIDLIVELQLLQSYVSYNQPDSLTVDSLRNEIFNHYNVSETQFQESHKYYQDHDLRAQRDRIGEAIEDLRKDKMAGQDSTMSRSDSLEAEE